MALVPRRLDFNRTHLAAMRQEEINFIVVLAAFGWPCVVKEQVASCHQHLRNDILIHISQVSRQLVIEQLLINHILGNILVLESQRNEKTSIVEVHLITV